VIPAEPVVTNARAFYTTRAAAGAVGTRRFLRPLFSRDQIPPQLGRTRRENADLCLALERRHSGMVRRTRPRMCNCTSGNPWIPGSMLRIAVNFVPKFLGKHRDCILMPAKQAGLPICQSRSKQSKSSWGTEGALSHSLPRWNDSSSKTRRSVDVRGSE
jgi:hypothetical protein